MKRRNSSYFKKSIGYSKKRVSVLTQQYYNGSNMEEIFHYITKKLDQEKSMTSTDRKDVEVSFSLKTSRHNIMHTFFIQIYMSLQETQKECLMREHTKQPYEICTNQVVRVINLCLLMYQWWVMVLVFLNILSSMKEVKKCQVLPRTYVGSYSGEKGCQFLQ